MRRSELAWAASVVAKWSHFVAFGVYAYGAAGAAGGGLAGVVRLLLGAVFREVHHGFVSSPERCCALLGSVCAGTCDWGGVAPMRTDRVHATIWRCRRRS